MTQQQLETMCGLAQRITEDIRTEGPYHIDYCDRSQLEQALGNLADVLTHITAVQRIL